MPKRGHKSNQSNNKEETNNDNCNSKKVIDKNTMLNEWLEASSLDILLAPCQTLQTAEEKKKRQLAKRAEKKREKRYVF